MYHTSPVQITEGMINTNGISSDCLFFSDDIYVMGASGAYHVYEADFDCVRASQLHDEDIINEIADYFSCEPELAESLLDSSENEWNQDFDCEGGDSWWLQGKRGECAVKMGYDGCEDVDEQGTVYIIPMQGRESELNILQQEF